MKFNLLLYVPVSTDNVDITYGVFVQHHLMDDANIDLDYFEFKKINPENYALDIVDEKEVTKNLRVDCLVDGFALNSYYSIDLNKSYNRNISKQEVRQIFICFKNNSKEPIDAFIRVNEEQDSRDYQVYNNLIFFTLWASPDMEGTNDLPLNVGKVNYSDFEYFRETIDKEVNYQWHSFLNKKRDRSKLILVENARVEAKKLNTTEDPNISESQTIVLENNDILVSVPHIIPGARIEDSQPVIIPQSDTAVINNQEGSEAFKIIAYILLALGVVSILVKLLGGS